MKKFFGVFFVTMVLAFGAVGCTNPVEDEHLDGDCEGQPECEFG